MVVVGDRGSIDRKQEGEFGTLGIAEVRSWKTINTALKEADLKEA